jgi:hypothetical protein
MISNYKMSEGFAVIGNIAPISQGVGSVTSAWLPIKNYQQIMAIVNTGVLGTAATVDAKFQQAKDVSGTDAKDITGKTITQIVKATGDGKQAVINIRMQELDINGGFTHVQLSVTVAAAASLVSADVLALSRNLPASTVNQAAVVQVV